MRTAKDRLRHTILFELLGLVTVTPLAALILNKDMGRIGALAVAISLLAMATNYVFNLAFDHALVRMGRPVNVRPPWMRALHAVLFEATLMLITLPIVAWWLNMSLWQALATDVGFALFYLAYAYVYNWAYDRVFPMPSAVRIKAADR
ncbi:PACE efflux transporter [Salidesulfovibrio onnuriiensis]|uniref:PACE efflux transporter n=1 Tax=Salidesulfovibrio onnuriiensis TaxID=2583823 RepID=UPI0011CB11BD|nr:PACE efflux transporter [Salidesulfovibrio onnuriiensis]